MIKATLADKAIIFDLYDELIKSQAKLEPDFYQEATQGMNFIEDMINNEDSDILIVLEQEQIVGFSVIKEMTAPSYPMFRPKEYAYIYDLVVRESARKKGFGKALLQSSVGWMKERELEYLELAVLDNNKDGKSLYENFGFRSFSKQMIYKEN